MHILVTRHEALLDVSGVLLTTENRYDSEGRWDLEAKVP
jgi:hypothetical protein